VIRGADLAARREGLHLVLSSSHTDATELIQGLRSMRGRIDGLIAMAPHIANPEAICDFSGQLPIVLLTPGREMENCHTISIADFDGAREMTHHLLAMGHRVIAFVKGPEGNVESEERLKGYRAALGAEEIRPSPKLELDGDFSEAGGYRAARKALECEPRPTAIVSSNDYTAVGVLRALRERGVRVPGDVAVTGFDDIELSTFTTPPLTTVRVEMYRLGERAVELLVGSIRDRDRHGVHHEVLPTSIVVRDSCGARRPRESGRSRGVDRSLEYSTAREDN
jgi:LacI family transcriptional regulator